MHFITTVYGDDYVPLVSVCLETLLKTHPNDKVTVLWDEISNHEINLLKYRFKNYSFEKQKQNIPNDNIHRRIPLKLRFWSNISKKFPNETLCFIDSDMLIKENIDEYENLDFDFLYTYKDEKFPLNVGIVLVKNSPKITNFLNEWLDRTEKIVDDPKLLENALENNGAADQQALYELMDLKSIEKGGKKKFKYGELIFKGISCEILNQTNSVPVSSKSKIFHYKGGWRPILLREEGFSHNRSEEASADMKAFWETNYSEFNDNLLKNYVIDAATKYKDILPWDKTKYEERGILHSEMLAVISVIKKMGVELIIESGRARGQSTEMLAKAFKNDNVPIKSIEWMRDDASEFAEKNLAKYSNVELLYGDANQVLPEILEKNKDKKIAVLFDGPKGEDAYSLFAKVIIQNKNILVGFFHDCRKSFKRMINPSRDLIYKYFDRLFFTDDLDYVEKFKTIDQNCIAKEGHINMHSFRPYKKGYDTIGSYGPTIGVVFPTERDRERANKLFPTPNSEINLQRTDISMKTKRLIKQTLKKFLGDERARNLRSIIRRQDQEIVRQQLEKLSPQVNERSSSYFSLGFTTPERERILHLGLEYLGSSHVFGDYIEFGVWRGDTFSTAYHFAEKLSVAFPKFKEMNFHALDSFEGFPELKGDDNFPQFKAGGRAFSIEDFELNMKDRNLDANRMTITKGWFSDTLKKEGKFFNEIKDNSIAFAYIDCDLYESTIDVLHFLHSKMMSGGIMAFDDWFCFAGDPTKGEMKAFMEFSNKYKNIGLVPFERYHWHGNSFIFHRFSDSEAIDELRKHGLII